MYNDNPLEFFVIAAMFFMSQDMPVLSFVCFALGHSIKGGALVLLPILAGWCHYHYGTLKLLFCICLVVLIQITLVSPFCYNPVKELLGWEQGKTTWTAYLSFFTGRRYYGCWHSVTRYWDTVSEHIFWDAEARSFLIGNPHFLFLTKSIMIGVHVYYFFVKMNSLPQCLSNLLHTFNQKTNVLTLKQQR